MKFTSFRNARIVRSSWLEEGGRRLDCNPYMSGALEARDALQLLKAPKEKLKDVTTGIFHAGREGRLWVDSPEYGVPFLGSSDILNADLSTLPLMSKKQIKRNPHFTLGKKWTLITRSGTIGRMAYVRPDMAGLACSEHVLRVVPNEAKIPAGYLYAFLSSKFGVPLVVSGTFGAIIQHIEAQHIENLPVPRLGTKIEGEIHSLVEKAATYRSEAITLHQDAQFRLFDKLQLKKPSPIAQLPHPNVTSVSSRHLVDRCDGYYYSARCSEARAAFDAAEVSEELGSVARVFIPGIFKRLYVSDSSFGSPYITGGDVFELSPISEKYLMRKVAAEYELLLKRGMIVVQEAGQLGGLIGRSVMVGKYLDGFACSNNMIRIVPNSDVDAGYLFALLSSEYGVRLLSREAAGSSIPHTDEGRVRRIRIPWPDEGVRSFIAAPAIQARELRDAAAVSEMEARSLMELHIERGQ